MTLDEVKPLVREHLERTATERDIPYSPGELRWARYGRLLEGAYIYGSVERSDRVRWVLIFDVEMESRLERLRNPHLANWWTATFNVEAGMMTATCGARV
jgi:hypothetical protein